MLSDHERKTLQEIERQFSADDPEFPRSFNARARRLGREHLVMPLTLTNVVAVLFGALLLGLGSPVDALAVVMVVTVGMTGVTWLIWLIWRHSGGTDRRR